MKSTMTEKSIRALKSHTANHHKHNTLSTNSVRRTRLLFCGVDRDSRRAYMPPSTETSRQIPGLEFPAKPSSGCMTSMPLVVRPSISPSLYHLVAFSCSSSSTSPHQHITAVLLSFYALSHTDTHTHV